VVTPADFCRKAIAVEKRFCILRGHGRRERAAIGIQSRTTPSPRLYLRVLIIPSDA
jgi:hypothetical protein